MLAAEAVFKASYAIFRNILLPELVLEVLSTIPPPPLLKAPWLCLDIEEGGHSNGVHSNYSVRSTPYGVWNTDYTLKQRALSRDLDGDSW